MSVAQQPASLFLAIKIQVGNAMFLEMKNITKKFGPVTALDDVSFFVEKGEIHGLLGENGAGKSTLMNILGGIFQPTAGEVWLNGQQMLDMNARKAFQSGIGFVHQELNLINDLKVYENLFLGEEIKNKWGTLNKPLMREKAREILRKMNLEINPDTQVAYLDTSLKQLVEIARALLFDCKLIIMDEPTTALTNREIENLFSIMRKLKEGGVSIIYISHKMPELFAICDKYTVLRDGKFIQSGNFKDIDEKTATHLLVGRSLVDEEIKKKEVTGDVVMKVENISCGSCFKEVSFTVRKGEVLAITGLHGDGRGELAEALFGARKLDCGQVVFKGEKINYKHISDVIRRGIGMVPRNRKERSIIKDMCIVNNMATAYFVAKHKKLYISRRDTDRIFEENQKKTAIKAGNRNDLITSLSGGNQQKVIISRWLEVDSELYILDNPTQGIDVGAKFEVYKIINSLAEQGKSILVFSSEFPEIYKVADRCLVMYKGRVTAELSRDELNEVDVMYYATGCNMEGIKNEN
jgi:ribose transport system ATP-binding protein